MTIQINLLLLTLIVLLNLSSCNYPANSRIDYRISASSKKKISKNIVIYLPGLNYKNKFVAVNNDNTTVNKSNRKKDFLLFLHPETIIFSSTKTKYGQMIKITVPPEAEYLSYAPYFHTGTYLSIDWSGRIARIFTHIFPYDLSSEFKITPRKVVGKSKKFDGISVSGIERVVETMIYVNWEGKEPIKLYFEITIDIIFGIMGESMLFYEIDKIPETDKLKTVKTLNTKNSSRPAYILLIKKPGWHKIKLTETYNRLPTV